MHYNLGITLRLQGQTAAAQKELSDLQGLHDFRARLAQAKALTLQGVDPLKRKQLDAALESFQRAIAHYNLALVLQREGNEAASRAELGKAYEIEQALKNAPQ